MDLLYKPDWEEAKKRYEAWWAHEHFGRCGISVTAPKSGLPPRDPPAMPARVDDRWLDFDYIAAANEHRLSRTFYGGEAVPIWHPGYPGSAWIPTFLGAPLTLAETTAGMPRSSRRAN
jgi:hypothetical protein